MSNISDKQVERKELQFSLWKIFVPVIIGIGVVIYMMIKDVEKQELLNLLRNMNFSSYSIFALCLAWLCMIGRDFGLSWRFRALTDKQLSWRKAIKVNFLCEFTSCVTPSAVGGSSFGIFYLQHEGIDLGRATTLVFTTIFLDELFLVLICPLIALLTPADELFATDANFFSQGLQLTFWLVYAALAIWTLVLLYGVIINPNGILKVLNKLFSIKFLRRWQQSVIELGDNISATSAQLRNKSAIWWIKAFMATTLSWSSRFLTVCALFMAFVPEILPDQWLIFVRQIVVWVVLIAMPTPGGSGVSEWLFTEFYANLIPSVGLAIIMAICWRIISYYTYLIIGAIIVPKWIDETIRRIRKNKDLK